VIYTPCVSLVSFILKLNPDKPDLNIDPPEAERFVVSLRSVFSIKIGSIPLLAVGSTSWRLKYSIWLWYKSFANMMGFE
jgi:hypothetical protein